MSDLVEKCARAIAERELWKNETPVYADDVAGRYLQKQVSLLAERFTPHALAVIDALADGVSDEMCVAAYEAWHSQDRRSTPPIRAAIAAAIRAAKSREG